MKVPKCLLMNYPALDLNNDIFTPSLLYSFNEYLLNFGMLVLCFKCYMEDDDNPKIDYLLSPICTPDEILKKYPKVYILICEKDPLHDGGMKFGLRFLKLKK